MTSSGSDLPLVSVVLPVRNEESHIGGAVEALLTQDYPSDLLEIIVVDGRSTDATRDVVHAIADRHPNVRLIDNPEQIASTALNRGFAEARGEVLIRVDGHCRVASDFVRRDVELLDAHPEAWCVGGPIVHRASTAFGRAAAFAMSHPVGVGGAKHRMESYEGYGEGAAFPAFRHDILDRVGEFDPDLVRNQDDEFNFRLNQAGGKVWLSPSVRYEYFVRERPTQLARQYFQYSFWRIPVLRKHRRPTTGRQIVPPLFFVLMAVLGVVGLWRRSAITAGGLPLAYMAGLGAVGLQARARGESAGVAARVPVAMGLMHGAYAAGWIWGGANVVLRRDAWQRSGRNSRISR